jgi:hypothetical protein
LIHSEFVEPWELRRAMAGYAAQGYPPRYGPHPDGGGFVVIIMVPDGGTVPDWRMPPSPPRRRHRWNLPRLTRGLTLALIAAALAYISYSIFTGAALEMPAQGAAIAVPTVPAVEMPWDTAGRQVSEAVEGITNALMLVGAILILCVLLWVALKARGLWRMVRK